MPQLDILREKIEEVVGQKIKSPKDFDFLSEQIFDKLHERISATTLKRLWGYVEGSTVPRQSTLDILARFIDYTDWEHFCKGQEEGLDIIQQGKDEQSAHNARRQHSFLRYYALLLTIVLALVFGVYAYSSFQPIFSETHDSHIIKVGEKFKDPHQYLTLFGINAKDSLWGQVLPHHPKVSIWGPQYHHPQWHNDGDKSQMMPTITEYWAPEGADSVLIAQRNFDQYKHYTRLNEVRITFMKDLVDSSYVYLGVYRLSLSLSDTSKCVWERVAGDCDLNKLDYIDELCN